MDRSYFSATVMVPSVFLLIVSMEPVCKLMFWNPGGIVRALAIRSLSSFLVISIALGVFRSLLVMRLKVPYVFLDKFPLVAPFLSVVLSVRI